MSALQGLVFCLFLTMSWVSIFLFSFLFTFLSLTTLALYITDVIFLLVIVLFFGLFPSQFELVSLSLFFLFPPLFFLLFAVVLASVIFLFFSSFLSFFYAFRRLMLLISAPTWEMSLTLFTYSKCRLLCPRCHIILFFSVNSCRGISHAACKAFLLPLVFYLSSSLASCRYPELLVL